MALVLKTPGVYIEEKSIFPPSVAQVETAIPAFIGYTEKADDKTKGDLHNKPKKISSLPEYRQYFGGSPPLNITGVTLDGNYKVTGATVQPKYYMFDSLQLFFSNGGGDCYIVSVGMYGTQVALGNRGEPDVNPGLDVGLATLEKVDEPTIIVFPDALLLPQNEGVSQMYELQKKALDQCNDLQDRVAVFDLLSTDSQGEEFRNRIGTNNLKYGAAYSPFLKTSLPKSITYRDFRNDYSVSDRFTLSGGACTLKSLTNEQEIQVLCDRIEEASNDLEIMENEFEGTEAGYANPQPEHTLLNRASAFGFVVESGSTLLDVIEFLHTNAVTHANENDPFLDYLDFLFDIVVFADGWFYDTKSDYRTSADFQANALANNWKDFLSVVTRLVAFYKGAKDTASISGDGDRFSRFIQRISLSKANYTGVDFDNVGNLTQKPPADTAPFTLPAGIANNEQKRRQNSFRYLRVIAESLLKILKDLLKTAEQRYDDTEKALLDQFPVYKNLLAELNGRLSELPPSGAIAGVYARVDASRGVWKAPANVSLNGVTDLAVHFTKKETDALNVDTNFGKSINAIKYFTGMGFMVWGARTLAGNDNEWRYIPVRRFYNMVEESVKKSTMWAVFEPNDAGTWVKVKGMIDNFLTLQWRNGALQGAKPDEAFFCNVGLGKTMTALDILEGRMIVEIGMAVVRPAEYIILTFSHMIATS